MGRALHKLPSFCFLLLSCFITSSVVAVGQANDVSSPAASAYVYVGWYLVQWPNLSDYISGYSVASDGSLQPLTGFPVSGPSFGLVSVRNFVFGFNTGNYLATYTRGANGSLSQTSIVNENQYAPQDYGMGIYALNPDRAGLALNTVLSCGSCNSYVLPFAIGSNGQLSYVGGAQPPGGPAKWDGIFFYSPANNYAYTDTWGGFGTLARNADGSLSWLSNESEPEPPPSESSQEQVCYPGDVASSSTGYLAMAWWGRRR